MENNLTIKQISDQLNISKQAVWQKIKRNPSEELSKNMIKKGNTVFITKRGQSIIKSMFNGVDDNNGNKVVNVDEYNDNVDDNVDETEESKNNSSNMGTQGGVTRKSDTSEYKWTNGNADNSKNTNDNVDVNKKRVDNRMDFFEETKNEILFLKNLVKELQEEKKEVYKILDQQQQLSLHDKNLIQKYEDENKELRLLMESNQNPEQEKPEPTFVKEAISNVSPKKTWWKFWD